LESQEKAHKCFSKGSVQNVNIPRIVLKLAAKFQLKSEAEISLEELLADNPVVDTFIQKCVWRESIVEDTAIPRSTDLLDVSTHWWTTFDPVVAVPSDLRRANVTEATLAAGDVTGAHRHMRQVSGIKRPPPDDYLECSEEEGNMAPASPQLKEPKRRKVIDREEMQFRPVRKRVHCDVYSLLTENRNVIPAEARVSLV
jgi:hypothetical protein